jgi:hypothetical protein
MRKDELDRKFKQVASEVLERYAKHHSPSTLEQELVEAGYQAALVEFSDVVHDQMIGYAEDDASFKKILDWLTQALAEGRRG